MTEYTPAWVYTKNTILYQMAERAKKVMDIERGRLREEEEISEPVKTIIALMNEYPDRFDIKVKHLGDDGATSSSLFSVDKKTGHRLALMCQYFHHRDMCGRIRSSHTYYSSCNKNPWLNRTEIKRLCEVISVIDIQKRDKIEKMRNDAIDRRLSEGRSKVLEMYSADTKYLTKKEGRNK